MDTELTSTSFTAADIDARRRSNPGRDARTSTSNPGQRRNRPSSVSFAVRVRHKNYFPLEEDDDVPILDVAHQQLSAPVVVQRQRRTNSSTNDSPMHRNFQNGDSFVEYKVNMWQNKAAQETDETDMHEGGPSFRSEDEALLASRYVSSLGQDQNIVQLPGRRRRRPFDAFAMMRSSISSDEHFMPSERTLKNANRMCSDAIKLLHKLTQPRKGWTHSVPVMPKSAIKYCKGIVVLRSMKVGVGVGVIQGSGFLLVKLKQTGCVARWSAPCCFSVHAYSLGATLGYHLQGRVCCIDDVDLFSPDDIIPYNRPLALNISWVMEYADGANQLRAKGHGMLESAIEQPESGTRAIYSWRDGAMMDVSIKYGAWKTDHSANHALYGPGVAPFDILAGDVAPLPEFITLYQLLNSYGIESAI